MVLAWESVALIARLFVLSEEIVEVIIRVLQLTRFDVSAVSSLFHGSAPGGVGMFVYMIGWPKGRAPGLRRVAPYRV